MKKRLLLIPGKLKLQNRKVRKWKLTELRTTFRVLGTFFCGLGARKFPGIKFREIAVKITKFSMI